MAKAMEEKIERDKLAKTKEMLHEAAVGAVVRFLKAQNPETAREAIKQYLEQ